MYDMKYYCGKKLSTNVDLHLMKRVFVFYTIKSFITKTSIVLGLFRRGQKQFLLEQK